MREGDDAEHVGEMLQCVRICRRGDGICGRGDGICGRMHARAYARLRHMQAIRTLEGIRTLKAYAGQAIRTLEGISARGRV